jgi:probable rRNA maturation factor
MKKACDTPGEDVVLFEFSDVEIPGFLEDTYRGWLKELIEKEGHIPGTIVFIFCTDDFLVKLNNDYLHHDTLTDIITFDYGDEFAGISGDIFISTDRIADNSNAYGVGFDTELLRVMIHGILHLIGYKDGTAEEKIQMRERENYYLSLFF